MIKRSGIRLPLVILLAISFLGLIGSALFFPIQTTQAATSLVASLDKL